MESITCFQVHCYVTDNIPNTLMLTITYFIWRNVNNKNKSLTYKMNTCLFISNLRFSKNLLYHGEHVEWWIKVIALLWRLINKIQEHTTYFISKIWMVFTWIINFFLLISKCLTSETWVIIAQNQNGNG